MYLFIFSGLHGSNHWRLLFNILWSIFNCSSFWNGHNDWFKMLFCFTIALRYHTTWWIVVSAIETNYLWIMTGPNIWWSAFFIGSAIPCIYDQREVLGGLVLRMVVGGCGQVAEWRGWFKLVDGITIAVRDKVNGRRCSHQLNIVRWYIFNWLQQNTL